MNENYRSWNEDRFSQWMHAAAEYPGILIDETVCYSSDEIIEARLDQMAKQK